jgi:hypothetical protein
MQVVSGDSFKYHRLDKAPNGHIIYGICLAVQIRVLIGYLLMGPVSITRNIFKITKGTVDVSALSIKGLICPVFDSRSDPFLM